MLNPYKGGEFRVTSRYGIRTLNGVQQFHSGLDLVGESSKELLAICDGVIEQSRIITDKSNLTWQWGNYVCLKADTGELIFYCHLSERLVSKGQRVKKGELIGIEGNTGYSFGSHCHLEIRNASNKVTDEVNTPKFTGIPNAVGTYTVKEDIEMTREEIKKMIDEAIEESKPRVWHYWSEIEKEAPWAYKPLMALYKKGFFQGASPSDLQLEQVKMETLVALARPLKELGVVDY